MALALVKDLDQRSEVIVPLKVVEPSEPKKTRAAGKKKGQKSEVYPYEPEDLKKMLETFKTREQYTHYLALIFSCNMARRIGDTLNLKWKNVFKMDGTFRTDLLEITEDKTDKLANPHINKAVKEAVRFYIEKTGAVPEADNYEGYIFLQLSGTHKGKVMSEDAHLKALKKCAADVGIEYNIGTHSGRKFFGMMSRNLHMGDNDSMELLQTIFNHSDSKTTKNYIGLTKKKTDQYYDDMGDFFTEYMVGNKEFAIGSEKPVVAIDSCELRDIISLAYRMGAENAGNPDGMVHIEAMNQLMKMLEEKVVK